MFEMFEMRVLDGDFAGEEGEDRMLLGVKDTVSMIPKTK